MQNKIYRKKHFIEAIGFYENGDVLAKNLADTSDDNCMIITKEVFEKTYEEVGETNAVDK